MAVMSHETTEKEVITSPKNQSFEIEWQSISNRLVFVYTCSVSAWRNFSAGLENTWYFFHMMLISAARPGERGRNVSLLFPEVLMIRSKDMAYPNPSSTNREALNSKL